MANSRPIDALLVAGLGLTLGPVLLVAPWEVASAAVAVGSFAWMAQRTSRASACVLAAAMSLGACRGGAVVASHESLRAAAARALPQPARCNGRGRVDSSPIRVREAPRWDAFLWGLTCDGEPVSWSGRATLYGGPSDLARGDVVELVVTLSAPERFWNGASGDPRPSEAHRAVLRTGGTLDVRVVHRARGFLAVIDRVRATVRARIDATFAADLAPMARALVLGESDLSPDDDRSFRASGLSHLLAVSGMHLVLVMALVVSTLEGLLMRIESVAGRIEVGRAVAGIGLPVAWIYAEFAGAGGSTLRAACMATASLAARALGRRTDATRAFGISILVMALADPLVAFDLSFSLSAAATGGLLAFGRPLAERLASRVPSFGQSVARAVATTLAASLPCVPILARFAPTVPAAGVVANVLAVPVGECAALPLCLAQVLIPWWPSAERGCAECASGALIIVRAIARAASVPALTVDVPQPTSWQFAVLAAVLAAMALGTPRRGSWTVMAGAVLVALEVRARAAGAPRGLLRVTFLDVGQGDAAIVDLPDGEALIVDGGGLVGSPIDVGERVLAPELRVRRRTAALAAVLTHPHPDHFGGFVRGLDAVRLGALWDTGQGELEHVVGGYDQVLAMARARGLPVLRPDRLCGPHAIADVVIDVLAPCPGFSSDRGPNDNSFVIRFTFGSRAVLMVGDAELDEENTLLATASGRLRADVLKVGHHGSRTSSSARFLAAVAPSEAVISVGTRNRFGHPSSVTLATLTAVGARVWRTDRDGAVVVTTDGRRLDVARQATD